MSVYLFMYICRVGQNCIYTPYMTVYLVISLPIIPYVNRIYMVLANPIYVCVSHRSNQCAFLSANESLPDRWM